MRSSGSSAARRAARGRCSRRSWASTSALRGSVRFSDEDSPSATVGDRAITIELYRGHDGNPSTISNAPLGLAPVYRIGRSSGRGGLFGDDFEAVYAETADFEYSG